MAFNTISYFIFLAILISLYYIIPNRIRWIFVLGTSVFFFLTFTPQFFLIFIVSILINYYLTFVLDEIKNLSKRKYLLSIVIIFNILTLILFKYFDISNYLNFTKFNIFSNDLSIIVPIGISFYTFKMISYNVDVYNRKLIAEKNLGMFATYCFFFPNLVQGPIDRASNLLNQFKETHNLEYENISLGFRLIVIGLFKKLVVADRLSIYTSAVFGNYENHSGITLIIGTIFYSFQIYADFSGYSDIAIGSARLMGYKLMNNFNLPYFAKSISEFWQRWHISLSIWLRDYLFLPISYNLSRKIYKYNFKRHTKDLITYVIATTITFAVCGLWHGTGMNFFVWGLIFAIYLTFGKATLKLRNRIKKALNIKKNSHFNKIIGTITVFILVSFAWIFFYSKSLSDAKSIIKKIFEGGTEIYFIDAQSTFFYSIFGILALFLFDTFIYMNSLKISNRIYKAALYSCVILTIIFLGVFDGGQFIYFKF